MQIRFYQNIGICIAPIMGVFWFRTNYNIYFVRAPWNHPLFSERYGFNTQFKLLGWRFSKRNYKMKSEMKPDAVFTFGSNEAGVHGAGAARLAFQSYGAVWGKGEGLYGQSYAIPTKGRKIEMIHLDDIQNAVTRFLTFAKNNPHKHFKVTCVGCGLAGYNDEDIAPMFKDAPDNCYFDTKWKPYLGDGYHYWGTF